jgi:hypothetical protein
MGTSVAAAQCRTVERRWVERGAAVRYTYFDISNFKGIRRLRLDLGATPVSNVYTLVGLNESGKTTILEALSYFAVSRTDAQKVFGTTLGDPERLIPIAQRANFSDSIVIDAGIHLDDDDVAAFDAHLCESSGKLVSIGGTTLSVRQTIAFKNSRHDAAASVDRSWTLIINVETADGQVRLGADSPVWQAGVQYLRQRLPVIRFFPNFLFDFPERLYLEPAPDNAKETFYRDLVRGIVSSLGIDANIEDHLLARARSTDPLDRPNLDGLLLDMSRHVTKSLFSAWNEVLDRAVGNKEVVIDLGIDRSDQRRVYVRFRIKDSDGYYTLSERSLGFRWFFVYLLLTTYAGSLSANGRPLLYLLTNPRRTCTRPHRPSCSAASPGSARRALSCTRRTRTTSSSRTGWSPPTSSATPPPNRSDSRTRPPRKPTSRCTATAPSPRRIRTRPGTSSRSSTSWTTARRGSSWSRTS